MANVIHSSPLPNQTQAITLKPSASAFAAYFFGHLSITIALSSLAIAIIMILAVSGALPGIAALITISSLGIVMGSQLALITIVLICTVTTAIMLGIGIKLFQHAMSNRIIITNQ